jgi:hypothetical protein
MPPEPGAVRALSVPLKLMDQARALKHDKDLSNRRVREDPARPVDPVNLAGDMRVIAWPAAGYGVAAAAGPGGDEDEQA